MLRVALTGNIAAGKSSVLRLFERWGAAVIDADAIVHELERPGTAVFDGIVRRFGPGVLAADGTLDRSALRRVVFADPAARRDLEAIVHPTVRDRQAELEAQAARRGSRIVVHDIPLLFESADPAAFDRIVLVDAPPDVRRLRLVQSRQLSLEEADRLIAAQLPADRKRSRSHHVIVNDSLLGDIEPRARAVWDALAAEVDQRA